MRYIAMFFMLGIVSCQQPADQGHDHEADGGHAHKDDGLPSIDTTIWTDKTELFVEFPALVVGYTSRFAAHFTVMDRHKPVREGTVSVNLIKGNKGIRHTAEAPSSPGIFTPSLQPAEAGNYKLVFQLETPSYSDTITIEDVKVYSTVEEAATALGAEEDDGAISFLKEQAWKMEFQTVPVTEGAVFDIIPTYGVWKVAPSDNTTLVAANAGTVLFRDENITEGRAVKKGEMLMSVQSKGLTARNLGAEIRRARAVYEQTRAEYERKKELYEIQVIPKAEFEQAEQQYEVAEATYENLVAGYSQGGKQVTVPFNGYIKTIAVDNGSFVEEGAELVTITKSISSILEAQVNPSFAEELETIRDIYYQPTEASWSSLSSSEGQIISVGKKVDRNNPLLTVYAEVDERVHMPEGSFTEVQIAYGEPDTAAVVPVEALLEDYGDYSVIVQLSGESFERRPVEIGKQNGKVVEITEGLAVGEMVVTKGAYQVKMASMSGKAPAHGHAH